MQYDAMKSVKEVLSEEGEKQLKHGVYTPQHFPHAMCPIMQVPFEEGDKITILPCNHMFDSNAIRIWLKEQKAQCPVCRYQLDCKELYVDVQETNLLSFQEIENIMNLHVILNQELELYIIYLI
jgi:hypothetical protein